MTKIPLLTNLSNNCGASEPTLNPLKPTPTYDTLALMGECAAHRVTQLREKHRTPLPSISPLWSYFQFQVRCNIDAHISEGRCA